MPVPVSQGRVKKFTTDGPIPPPRSRRGVVPQVDPTKKLAAALGQLLGRPGASRSPTRRGRGIPCGRHPPYRLRRPVPLSLLSPLPQTATLGRGMATPLSAHFPNCRADQMPSALPHSAAKGLYAAVSPAISPAAVRPAYLHFRRQRHPARATPCKPKGSVLPRFIGPGGRARRAKKCIGLRVGGAKRVAASKAALPPKKRRALFPSQLSFKEQWLWQSAKKEGGAETCPRPPAARAKPAPFSRPAAKSARSASHTKPFALAVVLGCQASSTTVPPRHPSGRGKLLCPQWSAPFPRAVRLPATEIAGKPGRGRTSPLPDRGSSACRVDFAGAAPYNIGWFIV